MQVQARQGLTRFKHLSVPVWFGVKLHPPAFPATEHVNSVDAIFHFNLGECSIKPVNYVVDYKTAQMQIDRSLYFLKMECSSVMEAKRRATVLAYLTYDLTRHQFVKVNTSDMLTNPFNLNSTYETLELYGLELKEPEVDIKSLVVKQSV